MTAIEFMHQFSRADLDRALERILSKEDIEFLCNELMENKRLYLQCRIDSFSKLMNEADGFDPSFFKFKKMYQSTSRELEKLKENYNSIKEAEQ